MAPGYPQQPSVKLPTSPSNKVTVHRLMYGRSACIISDLHGLPRDWPPGHKWASSWEDVNCPKCRITR